MSFIDRADAIAKRLERFVSGAPPSDPLYVSNRTLGKKIRFAVLMGTPILALAGLAVLAMTGYFDPANPNKIIPTKTTAGEITAKILPNLDKEYRPDSDRRVEVAEAVVAHVGDAAISGKLRNNTDQPVTRAEVVFDVADSEGSSLGAVSINVDNIPAHGTAAFRQAIEQRSARSVIVREVHVR